mmetsp:Transcript_71646/g.191161  ORF Transcript_71646/g.191161 Transcript_71646/m.191161 type:complete len:270 (-) Transcript_71646:42-851(-)
MAAVRLALPARRCSRLAAQAMAAVDLEALKKQTGYRAVDDFVKSGMIVGLGTGSTAKYAVDRVAEKLKSGELKDVVGIPTSERTKQQAEELGVPLTTLNDITSQVDVAIDGADAVDPGFNLVKGGGGAHLREKLVEAFAKQFVVIVDQTKVQEGLGPSFPLPVEIVPFGSEHIMRQVAQLPAFKDTGCRAQLRKGSASTGSKEDGPEVAVTDNGNYIVDLFFEKKIPDPGAAAQQLQGVVGVVEHGLFCGMATDVLVAYPDGVRPLKRV